MDAEKTPVDEGGFGLVEFTFAASLFVTGVLALAGTLLSSMVLARDSRETTLAHDEAMSVIEGVKDLARQDFTAAIQGVVNSPSKSVSIEGLGGSAIVRSRLILDETQLLPPTDLNGDGDFLDTNLQPGDINAAYIKTTVSWMGAKGRREVAFLNILSRPNIAGSGGQSSSETQGESGGSGNTGGGGSTPPSEAGEGPQMSTSSWSFDKDALGMEFQVAGAGGSPVIAMTIDTSEPAYVGTIKVGGTAVLSQKTGLPATGTQIAVSPFSLQEGINTIDLVKFAGSSEGGGSNLTSSSSFTVTFHFQDSTSASIQAAP